jgi:hypothetical protein
MAPKGTINDMEKIEVTLLRHILMKMTDESPKEIFFKNENLLLFVKTLLELAEKM